MKKLSSLANLTTGVSHGIITTDLDKIRLLADNIDSILTMLNSLSGGVEAQVLTKRSSALLDYGWSAPTGGSSGGSSGEVTIPEGEFCPGYAFTRVDADSITSVLDLDLTSLFSEGRRVRITDGGVVKYGAIDTRTYSTGTTINFIMEDAATIDANPSEVCLTSSVTSWVPVTNPFVGAINAIMTGAIGLNQWWVAVGDNGQFGVSSDRGATWTLLTTATTENLTCCVYNPDDEVFWAAGTAGILVSTSNCTSVVEDSTSIPALTATGSGDIYGISYGQQNSDLCIVVQYFTGNTALMYTLNGGASWAVGDTGLGNVAVRTGCLAHNVDGTGMTIARMDYIENARSGTRYLSDYASADTTGAFTSGYDSISQIYTAKNNAKITMYGCSDGRMNGYEGWTGEDVVTFSNPIHDFAYSPLLDMMVCVGEMGTVGYLHETDKLVTNNWTVAENSFAPTARVLGVARNDVDQMFIAVADNGQICRSTNGIS